MGVKTARMAEKEGKLKHCCPGMFSFDTKREPEKCALCGVTFCLPSACRDAPLGQRQGGVFRLPPPYLWTPPTPQRAKGYTPLTILKKKSKHKKASAAPVGAIALTLFSLLHLKPLSRCATAPPKGSGHARKLCARVGNLAPMPKAPPSGELAPQAPEGVQSRPT